MATQNHNPFGSALNAGLSFSFGLEQDPGAFKPVIPLSNPISDKLCIAFPGDILLTTLPSGNFSGVCHLLNLQTQTDAKNCKLSK
mgnify:FL=1